jgi:hypothetical protein
MERAFLVIDPAEAATVRTGLLAAELLGLLFQQGGQGPFRHARGGSVGDLLHGVDIDVEARAGLAKGLAGNNFAPVGSEITDFLELLRGEFAVRHSQSCLVLTRIAWDVFLRSLYRIALCLAKQVVTSDPPSFPETNWRTLRALIQ